MSNQIKNHEQRFSLKKYLHDIYEVEKAKYLLKERHQQLEEQREGKNNTYYNSYSSSGFEQSSYYQEWSREYKHPNNNFLNTNNIYKKDTITGTLAAIFGILVFYWGIFGLFCNF